MSLNQPNLLLIFPFGDSSLAKKSICTEKYFPSQEKNNFLILSQLPELKIEDIKDPQNSKFIVMSVPTSTHNTSFPIIFL